MIKIEGLTRCYGSFTAVDNVSFNIGRGEIVGLLGHNGAGKTTIMKMLTGFLEPTAGSIFIGGLDIATQRAAVQKKIGYLPENCPVYTDMTVVGFLEYSAALHGLSQNSYTAIREVMEQTSLSARATQLIGTLSRGYHQRVGVAQALLHKPEILILDEPTNGLDPSQIQHMRSLIKGLAAHATVILSTHILQEVQATCNRAIIINRGRLARDARLEDLRASSRLLLRTDAVLDTRPELFSDLDFVQRVVLLGNQQQGCEYAIEFDDIGPEQMLDKSPEIAQRIVGRGYRLYALHPEHRDLEYIFAEINAAYGDETVTQTDSQEAAHV